ncbi:unnamed protein product [Closterium sp. Naga37s-1]|nr:unnamed protein product [Closterium sp. Naga37s-1]
MKVARGLVPSEGGATGRAGVAGQQRKGARILAAETFAHHAPLPGYLDHIPRRQALATCTHCCSLLSLSSLPWSSPSLASHLAARPSPPVRCCCSLLSLSSLPWFLSSAVPFFSLPVPASLAAHFYAPFGSHSSAPFVSHSSAPFVSHSSAPFVSHSSAPFVSHSSAPFASHSSAPFASHSSAPFVSHSSAPFVSHSSAPFVSHSSAPFVSHSSAPFVSHSSAPFVSHSSAPFVSHSSAPFVSHSSASFASHSSAPFVSHSSAPFASHSSAPFVSHSSAPFVSHSSAPFVSHSSAPFVSHSSAPFASHSSAPFASHSSAPFVSHSSAPVATSTVVLWAHDGDDPLAVPGPYDLHNDIYNMTFYNGCAYNVTSPLRVFQCFNFGNVWEGILDNPDPNPSQYQQGEIFVQTTPGYCEMRMNRGASGTLQMLPGETVNIVYAYLWDFRPCVQELRFGNGNSYSMTNTTECQLAQVI